jgi:hypothetical protein
MKRSRITGAIDALLLLLLLLAACSSGRGQGDRSPPPISAPATVEASPSPAVQTAIPDGTYRTDRRTEKDLVALGLSKKQINFAKNQNEHWKRSIVYELRISGDQFVLFAASDGGNPVLADHGTFVLEGNALQMFYVDGSREYAMGFDLSGGELHLTVLHAFCAKSDPKHCAVFLVRAAYEALPFVAVN